MPARKLKTNGAHAAVQTARDWREERAAVLRAAQAMASSGLVVATSGNVSCRLPDSEDRDLMAVTPSSLDYQAMTVDDIVVVDFEGDPVLGERVPSSETLIHAAIYRARPDVGAVMHTHSTYASALAVSALELPAMIDEMVILLGGRLRVADYGFPGTEELAEHVVRALGERNAVLLRSHGLIGVGRSPEEALHVCELTERLAHIYTLARMMGRAHALPADVVQAEIELFRMRRQAEG